MMLENFFERPPNVKKPTLSRTENVMGVKKHTDTTEAGLHLALLTKPSAAALARRVTKQYDKITPQRQGVL